MAADLYVASVTDAETAVLKAAASAILHYATGLADIGLGGAGGGAGGSKLAAHAFESAMDYAMSAATLATVGQHWPAVVAAHELALQLLPSDPGVASGLANARAQLAATG